MFIIVKMVTQRSRDYLCFLLNFIEIFLLSTQEPNLTLRQLKLGTNTINGPANLIRQWMGDILPDMMSLIKGAVQASGLLKMSFLVYLFESLEET